jgi:hypothetical protein
VNELSSPAAVSDIICLLSSGVSLQVILDSCQDPEQLSSLCHVTMGGEVVTPALVAQASHMLPQADVFNVCSSILPALHVYAQPP